MPLSTGYENRRARIEIVPLIDVVFLLLVFFIYAMLSMTVYRGLRVTLPRAGGAVEEAGPLVITIAADDGLWLDDRPVSVEEAVARAVAHTADGAGPVLINGDREAGLGTAVELLARLQKADVQSVSFRVEPWE